MILLQIQFVICGTTGSKNKKTGLINGKLSGLFERYQDNEKKIAGFKFRLFDLLHSIFWWL